MQLSLSNLGFLPKDTDEAYALLKSLAFSGLEIAPSLFVGEAPYNKISEAVHKANNLRDKYGLVISSMQSIWYGQSGNIFHSEDAKHLIDYTKKAVDFAKALGCKNLVFGCPKNRNMPSGAKASDAIGFFSEIAQYAFNSNTAIALEANPKVYGTDFINTSEEAFNYAKNIPHLKVNYDLGTFITNSESLNTLYNHLDMVNHVHISEPALALIARRPCHKELASVLGGGAYKGFVSIEMSAQPLQAVAKAVGYIKEIFAC